MHFTATFNFVNYNRFKKFKLNKQYATTYSLEII